MIRVNAWRIIALVTDEYVAIKLYSMSVEPRNSMAEGMKSKIYVNLSISS